MGIKEIFYFLHYFDAILFVSLAFARAGGAAGLQAAAQAPFQPRGEPRVAPRAAVDDSKLCNAVDEVK